MRKWECGSGNSEGGIRKWEVGIRKWECGSGNAEVGIRKWEFGSGNLSISDLGLRIAEWTEQRAERMARSV